MAAVLNKVSIKILASLLLIIQKPEVNMNYFILPILFLSILFSTAHASEYISKQRKWEKCNHNELKTQKAIKIRETQGVRALHQHLIMKCGYRAVKENSGVSFLHPSDCTILFNYAMKSQCDKNEYSEYLSLFILELNPKVFSEHDYQEACKQNKHSTESEQENHSIFIKKVCLAKNL